MRQFKYYFVMCISFFKHLELPFEHFVRNKLLFVNIFGGCDASILTSKAINPNCKRTEREKFYSVKSKCRVLWCTQIY